jgi:hypothetical protein
MLPREALRLSVDHLDGDVVVVLFDSCLACRHPSCSGNLRIITRFFRGSERVVIAESRVRVFYDE